MCLGKGKVQEQKHFIGRWKSLIRYLSLHTDCVGANQHLCIFASVQEFRIYGMGRLTTSLSCDCPEMEEKTESN